MMTQTSNIVRKVLLLIVSLSFTPIASTAAKRDTTSTPIIHLVGINLGPAYLFPTHRFFKGENSTQEKMSTTFSGHLKYGFKFAPNSRIGSIYPYTIQGVGIGYNTFLNTLEIGNPLNIYLFQSSRITRISPNLSLDYEWNFGASLGWKRYDEEKNPLNMVVGSKINAYINLGFLLNWQVSPHTNLRAGVTLTHYSNGNTNYPNAGVNTLGAYIGITRFFGDVEKYTDNSFRPPKQPFNPYINYDLIVYGATRKKGLFPENSNPMLVPGSFGIIGLNFNPLYNFNKHFRAGASLDLQYDESANIGQHLANDYIPGNPEDLKFYRPSFREQFSAGLSARVEVVMPIFSINLGVGKNFLCKGGDTNSFYQTFVLKANLTRQFFLHAGYQLYRFKDPNNLMLGLGYRFNAK